MQKNCNKNIVTNQLPYEQSKKEKIKTKQNNKKLSNLKYFLKISSRANIFQNVRGVFKTHSNMYDGFFAHELTTQKV